MNTRIEWFQNGADPLLHPLVWGDGHAEFMWPYHRSQGLYVVKPQPPKLRLVKND